MKPAIPLPLVLVAAVAMLSACQHFEQIRLRAQGPSPAGDHCLACTDIGQAWALFRMGEYDQADIECALVIDAEPDPDGLHARRARDIASLARGFLSIRYGDLATARADFDQIRDPRLRELGKPYIDPRYGSGARVSKGHGQSLRASTEIEPRAEPEPCALGSDGLSQGVAVARFHRLPE